FRSEWGGEARSRRQAHAQGPAACGVWGTGRRENDRRSPKKGFSRVWTLERVRAEPAGLPAGRQGERAAREERLWMCESRADLRVFRGSRREKAAPPRFPLPGAPAKQLLKDRPLRKRPFSATHQNQARQL